MLIEILFENPAYIPACPQVRTSSSVMHRRPRPFRNVLPNLFQRLRPSGGANGRSTRSSDVSGDTSSYTDSISMFSVPASYSAGYYDRVGDDSDESESFLTVSDLDNYRPRRPKLESEHYYAQYANIRDERGGLEDKTPTNSPTPKPSLKMARPPWQEGAEEGNGRDFQKLSESSQKVARIESLRDTHRRMKALTHLFPSFSLDTQVEASEEVIYLFYIFFRPT